MQGIIQCTRSTFLFWLIVSLLILPPVYAAVSTNITSDGTLGTNVIPGCQNCVITGGTRAGSNLFHSFGRFDVGTGKVATFSNDTALPTTNILSRVTGGLLSNIDGTIRTSGFGSANFFLMNPSGIVFGPEASLDLAGSFHATTADYLSLGGGNFDLSTSVSQAGVLTSPTVQAFGFTSGNPKGIRMNGSFLQVDTGKTISIIAGQQLGSASAGIHVTDARVNAPSGRINLISVGQQSTEVEVTGQEVAVTGLSGPGSLNTAGGLNQLGNILLEKGTRIFSDGQAAGPGGPGGPIYVRAGKLTLVGGNNSKGQVAGITSRTSGSNNGANIEIIANTVKLTDGASVDTITTGKGNAGNVILFAEQLTLHGAQARIQTDSKGIGNGGDVILNVHQLSARDAVISSGSNRIIVFVPGESVKNDDDVIVQEKIDTMGVPSNGNAGSITIQGKLGKGSVANIVSLISTQVDTSIRGGGKGGDISIWAENLNVELQPSLPSTVKFLGADDSKPLSQINSKAEGNNNSGSIFLFVDNLFGKGLPILDPNDPEGAPRNVVIASSASNSTDLNNGEKGNGQAGTIIIAGTQGKGSAAKNITLENFRISARNNGGDQGGNIEITANNLELMDAEGDSEITTSSVGAGRAGDIILNVKYLKSQGSTISSSSTDFNFELDKNVGIENPSTPTELIVKPFKSKTVISGAAGTIMIRGVSGTGSLAEKIELTDSVINTQVQNGIDPNGLIGKISINSKIIDLNGAKIQTETEGAGFAGSISLLVDVLTASNFSEISSSSFGGRVLIDLNENPVLPEGPAGTINIQNASSTGFSLFSFSDSTIQTAASNGAAGSIMINNRETIELKHSLISASVGLGANANSGQGNIILTAPSIIMTGGEITAETRGFANAGSITIQSANLITQFGISTVPRDSNSKGSPRSRPLISSSSTGVDLNDNGKLDPGEFATGDAGEVRFVGINGGAGQSIQWLKPMYVR